MLLIWTAFRKVSFTFAKITPIRRLLSEWLLSEEPVLRIASLPLGSDSDHSVYFRVYFSCNRINDQIVIICFVLCVFVILGSHPHQTTRCLILIITSLSSLGKAWSPMEFVLITQKIILTRELRSSSPGLSLLGKGIIIMEVLTCTNTWTM